MNFYLWTMRTASMILFALALVILVGTVAFNVAAWHSINADPTYQVTLDAQQWARLIQSIVMSLETAALPLFGAAALWRADHWMARRNATRPEAAE